MTSNTIELPLWSLAPLYLNRGARFSAVYGKPDNQIKSNTLELIVTTIPQRFWSDVWRLEITTDDRPGNIARIMDIFASQSIEVLFSEASTHSFAKYNSMSFIISLLEYSTPSDGDVAFRMSQSSSTVPGLEFAVLSNFVDQTVFNDSGFPRFKLKRMNLYRHMTLALASDKYWAVSHDPDLFLDGEKHEFTPGARFLRALAQLSADVDYTAAVDTKERCIRILFFAANRSRPGYLQFSSPDLNSTVLYRISKIISDRQGNILRHQIRRGLSRRYQGAGSELGEGALSGRFDVTIETVDTNADIKPLLRAIVRAAKADAELKAHNVEITNIQPEL